MFSLLEVGRRTCSVVICCLSLLFAQIVSAQQLSNTDPGVVTAADLALGFRKV